MFIIQISGTTPSKASPHCLTGTNIKLLLEKIRNVLEMGACKKFKVDQKVLLLAIINDIWITKHQITNPTIMIFLYSRVSNMTYLPIEISYRVPLK